MTLVACKLAANNKNNKICKFRRKIFGVFLRGTAVKWQQQQRQQQQRRRRRRRRQRRRRLARGDVTAHLHIIRGSDEFLLL